MAGVYNLVPATNYHFRLVAENEVGSSEPSETVTIITAEEGIIKLLEEDFFFPLHLITAFLNLIFSSFKQSTWRQSRSCRSEHFKSIVEAATQRALER